MHRTATRSDTNIDLH